MFLIPGKTDTSLPLDERLLENTFGRNFVSSLFISGFSLKYQFTET